MINFLLTTDLLLKMIPNRFCLLLSLVFFILSGTLSQTILAADKILIPASPQVAAKSFFLEDANSGKTLVESNADLKLAPASLTKIMTVYVVFKELKNGHLSLDEMVTISEKAWKTPGSRMFVEVNKQVSIEDLLHGVIIQSGNDASVALAEHVAGDEATFAELMNQHAERMGMKNTHFTNSMGLPDPDHYTSARDMASLTRALINEFPEYYSEIKKIEEYFNIINEKRELEDDKKH